MCADGLASGAFLGRCAASTPSICSWVPHCTQAVERDRHRNGVSWRVQYALTCRKNILNMLMSGGPYAQLPLQDIADSQDAGRTKTHRGWMQMLPILLGQKGKDPPAAVKPAASLRSVW